MGSEMDFDGSHYSTASTAEWKRTQEITFTRWVNQHLTKVGKSINSLRTDLADGLMLIGLVQVLSGRKLPKHQPRPILRSHKIENVSLALSALKSEGVHLVNIANDDDDDLQSICSSNGGGTSSLTAQQRLRQWLQNRLPAVTISNFTTDWNNGRYLGYLVNSFDRSLCSDWYTWNPHHAKCNVRKAMDTAEKRLGVPQLIDPEDVTCPDVDEPSMITYLSQFRYAKVIRPKPSPVPSPDVPAQPQPPPPLPLQTTPATPIPLPYPQSVSGTACADKDKPGKPFKPGKKCKAFGQGLEFGTAGEQNRFMVDTRPAMSQHGTTQGTGTQVRLGLAIEGPSETQLTCTDNHDGFWTIDYKPDEPGDYTISVKLNNEHVERSPFKVSIGPHRPHTNHNNNGSIIADYSGCKHCQKAKLGPENYSQTSSNVSAHGHKDLKHANKSDHKGQPFSVSILGRNSPQYAIDKNGQGHKPNHIATNTQTVTFEEREEKTSSSNGRVTKPASVGATHEVSVTTTIDLSNGKTKNKVLHKDMTGTETKGAVKEERPVLPHEMSTANTNNAGTGTKYPPIPQEWLRPGHGNGYGTTSTEPDVNAARQQLYQCQHPHPHHNDYDMEIYTSKPNVVVHNNNGCPCRDCKANRPKIVVWTNDIDADGNKIQNNSTPYRETIVSSTVEIHHPQDSCHIM